MAPDKPVGFSLWLMSCMEFVFTRHNWAPRYVGTSENDYSAQDEEFQEAAKVVVLVECGVVSAVSKCQGMKGRMRSIDKRERTPAEEVRCY